MLRTWGGAFRLASLFLLPAISITLWREGGRNLHETTVINLTRPSTQPIQLHDVPSPVGTFKALLASTLTEQYAETQRYSPPGKHQPQQLDISASL
jgi:hypothetical protein